MHNIAFQGRFWPTPMSELGLPESASNDFFFEDAQGKMYDERNPKKDGQVETTPPGKKFRKDNWMKAAFINSDRNITVSMNYAKEISGSASKGVELNTIINATGGIEGIVNGMDPTEWNPATDPHIPAHFDVGTSEKGVVERADGSTVWDVARFEARNLRSQPGLYIFIPLILLQTIGSTFFQVGAFDTPLLLTPGVAAVGSMNTLTLLISFLILFG